MLTKLSLDNMLIFMMGMLCGMTLVSVSFVVSLYFL